MYQIGPRETRILIDIPDETRRHLESNRSVKAYLYERVLPTLPPSVRPSLEKALEEEYLRSVSNAWMPSTRNSTPGLLMLGDASNMRHPVTGAGMTVALKDVVLLGEMLHPRRIPSLDDTDSVLKTLRRFHWRRKAYSASLNILAQALYLLFVSEGVSPTRTCAPPSPLQLLMLNPDPALGIMQRGFIRYVQEGETNFTEPAWLMGGVVDSPLLLLRHFFKIAIYSIGLHLRQASWLGLPLALFQAASVFISAVVIIWRPIVDELQP